MPRRMREDTTVLFRAVITTTYTPEVKIIRPMPEQTVYVTYVGPFLTQGAAQAAITKASRPRYWEPPGSYTATGVVEVTDLNWRPNA